VDAAFVFRKALVLKIELFFEIPGNFMVFRIREIPPS
jgi:hypothetical protein